MKKKKIRSFAVDRHGQALFWFEYIGMRKISPLRNACDFKNIDNR